MSMKVFPTIPGMAWNSRKTQSWSGVKIQKGGGGRRKSLCTQAYAEWIIECAYTALDGAAIEQAAGFFGLMRGKFQPFLWLDPEDNQQTDVRIGQGNGVISGFQLLKNLGNYYVEPVKDVVRDTLVVKVDGVEVSYTLEDDGWVVPTMIPADGGIVTASFQYYWRVAFDISDMTWENFWYSFYKLNTIKLVTVT